MPSPSLVAQEDESDEVGGYDVALIVTVNAATYHEALIEARHLAEGIALEGENISAVLDYDYDNDGQRVLYLHSEDEPATL